MVFLSNFSWNKLARSYAEKEVEVAERKSLRSESKLEKWQPGLWMRA